MPSLPVLVAIAVLSQASATAGEPPRASPEERALAYLAREVPLWSRSNHCFSCHNNGDAARALYAGLRAGFVIAEPVLRDTTAWLSDPQRWDDNGGNGPFSDKRLARVQFTAALADARRAGAVKDPRALVHAAARLARDQAVDGSWPLEGEDGPGSPATYGRFLATYLAGESLRAADPVGLREPIARSRRWLLGHEVTTITDASVMLLATASDGSPRVLSLRAPSLALLRRGQSEEGGWGPFVASPPEVYDTALAVLALASVPDSPSIRPLITRGRAFLIARQQPDGSWIETTRPSGAESYAQRISTTGWAALALLATRQASPRRGPDPER